MKRLNTEQFVAAAQQVHGEKYDYSKVKYINRKAAVEINCPRHGQFQQKPDQHLSGKGCLACGIESASTKLVSNTQRFIETAKEVHGDRYDYTELHYINSRTKVKIKCRDHGWFWQAPGNHLQGNGCPGCRKNSIATSLASSTPDFILAAKEVHGDKYDYKRVHYINSGTKVELGCSRHGWFWQTPDNHLRGQGCRKCNESKGELAVSLWLDQHTIAGSQITYEREKIFADCYDKRPLRFDFWIEQFNTLVEFQGHDHRKPIDRSGRNPARAKQNHDQLARRDRIKRNYVNGKHHIIYIEDVSKVDQTLTDFFANGRFLEPPRIWWT